MAAVSAVKMPGFWAQSSRGSSIEAHLPVRQLKQHLGSRTRPTPCCFEISLSLKEASKAKLS